MTLEFTKHFLIHITSGLHINPTEELILLPLFYRKENWSQKESDQLGLAWLLWMSLAYNTSILTLQSQPLLMGQRVLKTLPAYKTPGVFSSITLHQPDSDSQLKNRPLYYVVNAINTHEVLFSVTGWSSFLSWSPSSIKLRVFSLGKLCSGWGDFSLVLCRLFDMLQTQRLSFTPWGLRSSQPTCGGKRGEREEGMWGRHKYSTMFSFWETSSRLRFQWPHLRAMPAPLL